MLAQRVQSSAPGSKEYNKAVEKIVRHNLKLIPKIARRAMRNKYGKNFGGNYTEDVFQCGVIGLTRAAQLYDPKKGYAFSTYANAWIFQAIQRDLYNNMSSIRIPENTIREYYSSFRDPENIERLRREEPQKFDRYVDAFLALGCRSLDSSFNPGQDSDYTPDWLSSLEDINSSDIGDNIFDIVGLSTTCDRSKEMVIEHFYGDMTIKDIAVRFDVSRNKAADMIKQCLESIKENMTLV